LFPYCQKLNIKIVATITINARIFLDLKYSANPINNNPKYIDIQGSINHRALIDGEITTKSIAALNPNIFHSNANELKK